MEIEQSNNQKLLEAVFYSWLVHFNQYKEKRERLNMNADFFIQVKAFKKWRGVFGEQLELSKKMTEASNFNRFI